MADGVLHWTSDASVGKRCCNPLGVVSVRISVAIGALTGYPLATTLSFAAAAGADGVELLVSRRALARGPQYAACQALERGVPILTVHSLLHYREHGIDSKLVDDVASVRFAAGIPTCEAIVLHPPLTGPRASPVLNRWLEAIARARAESENPDLRLAIENRGENYDGIDTQFLDDAGRLRRLAEEWDMSITFDVAHAASHDSDVVGALRACLPRVANVHFSDARTRNFRGGIRNGLFRDHQIPGEGSLPLAEVITTLRRGRYTGPVTVELSPLSLRAYWPPAARRRIAVACRAVDLLVEAAGSRLASPQSIPFPTMQRREESHEDA